MPRTPDSEIIQQFGGPTKLGQALGLSRQTIHNWSRRGIPKLGKYMIRDYAKRLKVTLPEGFQP